jgi:hypothetical protein
MADEKPKSATGPKVSPARTVASLILLLIVGVVCAIELRAGFGQMMSGKSLAAKSTDGEFKDLPLADARNLLSMSPTETTESRGPDTYYHYGWYSLLRPLMGQQSPKLTIVASNGENPMALAYFASDEPEDAARTNASGASAGTTETPPGMMGGPGMGGPGMGRGPEGAAGGTNSRPPLEEDAGSSDSKPATDAAAPSEPNAPAETTPAESPAPAEASAPSDTPAPAK